MQTINNYSIITNKEIALDIYELVLAGDTSWITDPGQFINIKLPEFYLRRPFSISHYDEESLTIVYQIQGQGTAALASFSQNQELSCLITDGRGFKISEMIAPEVVVIGGGLGIAPLVQLTKELKKQALTYHVILGYQSHTSVFYQDYFTEAVIYTEDGSLGFSGKVTDGLFDNHWQTLPYYCCGPNAMMKAVWQLEEREGQLLLEERMGCGFGVCKGCIVKTKSGNKRVCKDGPMFKSEDLAWNS